MTSPSGPLTQATILRFWSPLAATWLMMSAEGPLLAALIARLPDEKFNLAAYGVALAFALILEAPVVMMMSAATALARSRVSFDRLARFTYLLCLSVTALLLLLIWPPLFNWLGGELIGLPPNVRDLARNSLTILLPWPAMIGYRRLYQGLLIRNGQTRRVAYGTVIRLTAMAGTALALYLFAPIPGTYVGALALATGVTAEALASRWMARPALRELKPDEPDPPSYRQIASFYYPLALTSLLAFGIHPMVTFFLGQSRMAIESLAVWPVVTSLVFIFRSVGLAYQEVGIALIGEEFEGYRALRRFAWILALATAAGLMLIGFTPLSRFWFQDISGLSPDLSRLATNATRILAILPAVSVWLTFQRAMMVNLRRTRHISVATAIEVIGIAILMTWFIGPLDLVGAYAAGLAVCLGRLIATLYLVPPMSRSLRGRVSS